MGDGEHAGDGAVRITVTIEGGAAEETRVERLYEVAEDARSYDGTAVATFGGLEQVAKAAAKAAVELHTLSSI